VRTDHGTGLAKGFGSMSFQRESKVFQDGSFDELDLGELERRARNGDGRPALPLRDWVALAEAWRIAQALRETRGNRSAAARQLGIGRRTLYSKMEKLGLEPSWRTAAHRNDSGARLADRSSRG
jgi:DNA-binding NtrC family response regulator